MRLLLLALVLLAILVNLPSFTNGDTDPSDASVLRALYTSLNSPRQLTKWNANGGDPCGESWTGITCSGNKVAEIKISGLGLSGSLGSQLDSLKSVTNFDISNNNMGNQLPYQLPPNVQRLNLAASGFTGGLPYSISQMTSLQYLNVSHNQIQGSVVVSFDLLSALNTLDFSFNSMSGNLPQSFQSLASMNTMYLQNNQFTGTIDVLANLPLGNLNVENNQFTGWIPSQLKGIVQSNGNSWSTGPAPPPPPGTPPANNHNRNHKSRGNNNSGSDGGGKSGIGGGGIAGIVISVLVVGAIVAFFFIKKRSKRLSTDIEKLDNRPLAPLTSQEVEELKPYQTSSTVSMTTFKTPTAVNLRPPPIDRLKSFDEVDISPKPIVPHKKINTAQIKATQYSIADLQIATDSFNVENLIGEGSIGRVYCALFYDGKVLAVKKINSSILQNPEDFLNIVSDISQLHHPNIIELVGYCVEHGQYLLVNEFHKNGSLHDVLHLSDEDSKPLAWNSRVKIALGAARALEYLHEVRSPSLVHKNIKSANILLDLELNPHLSDSGLASLIDDADQALNQNTGSGYGAPEVAMYGQCTIKSDVYSFGVVMLELVTGRKPFDSERPRSEQSLVRWATPQLHDIDALAKMVDPALKGLYPVKSISRFADVIALCVQPEPEFRPPMSEVVEALVRLVQRANMSKRTYSIDRGSRGEAGAQDIVSDIM
ncbi:Protein STRUBBELIG-RECEPTOR FAMILY 6 [Capsicum chinense]|nr:Protein STRUBBELIG-RECEPTOR FAMILY 6 [Capsicum chinense]